MRRVEPFDPEHRPGRGGGRTGRHQADELRAGHLCASCERFLVDPRDDVVQRSGLPVLDVHRHLHEPGARQVEAERTDTRKPASPLAHEGGDRARGREVTAQVHVECDQRAPGAEDHSAGGRVQLPRPEVGFELAVVDPLLQSRRAAATVVRGAALRRRIDEYGQAELATDAFAGRGGGAPRALHVSRLQRDERHDVGDADARVRALVRAKVDSLDRHLDAGDQCIGEIGLRPDECEDGAVVVCVGVHVEKTRARRQRGTDRVDRRAVAAFAEVRHRLEWQHGRTLGVVKEYYDLRAPTYDDWYLGRGRYAARDAESWQRDLAGLTETIESLPPARTLDVACGTGFLTRHLQGDVTALDQSRRMLEIAQRSVPGATFRQGDALALPFPDASFERVFTGHFYGHLDLQSRGRFVAEARRVAPELIVVDAAERADHEREEIQQRELPDGSVWPILKRFFTPSSLADELGGGETVYAGPWFVVVRAAL